jgi:transcriptional regulator with XRE-family HTH domain
MAIRIRTWRDEAGMNLQQIGDQSGVSASTIYKIENLQTVPTIAVLLKVSNGLNRRPSELLADVEAGSEVNVLGSRDRPESTIEARAKLDTWCRRFLEMVPASGESISSPTSALESKTKPGSVTARSYRWWKKANSNSTLWGRVTRRVLEIPSISIRVCAIVGMRLETTTHELSSPPCFPSAYKVI